MKYYTTQSILEICQLCTVCKYSVCMESPDECTICYTNWAHCRALWL